MALLYSDNAKSLLLNPILAAGVSMTVSAGEGSLFPVLTASDWTYVTIVDATVPANLEIVKVTARAADVFTIERGVGGVQQAWPAGSRVELRITKALLDDIVALTYPYALVKDPTGFSDPAAVEIQYDSVARTITLIGAWTAWYEGVLVPVLTTGWASDPHSATLDAVYFLYHDGSAVVWSTVFPASSVILIAMVVYETAHKYALVECHGLNMPHDVHHSLHYNVGTWVLSGGTLGAYVLSSTTAANRRPNVSACTLYDEDLPTVNALLNSGSYTQQFLSGTNVLNYTFSAAEILPVSVANPYYNQFSTPNWTQTLMPANSVASVWLLEKPATKDVGSQAHRHTWIQPQWITPATGAGGPALATARNTELTKTLLDLFMGNPILLSREFVVVARVIIQYTGGNWTIEQVQVISGSRFSQTAGSVQGQFLSTVAVDGDTVTGNGTVSNPLIATAHVDGVTITGTGTTLDPLVASAPTGLTPTAIITANGFTASANDLVFVNTSGGTFSITLPATPINGDRIGFVDITVGGSFDTEPLVLNQNGNFIDGVNATFALDIAKLYIELVYESSNTNWVIASVLSTSSSGNMDLTTDQTVTSGVKTFVEFPKINGFDDWFLPSYLELEKMFEELHAYSVGGFANAVYWSSTENNATTGRVLDFSDGSSNFNIKTGTSPTTRPARAFTSTTSYALRGRGPANGWIFWVSGNDYLECALSNITGMAWSNVSTSIGTTLSAIGEGQNNTNEILAQSATAPSPKACNDLIITVNPSNELEFSPKYYTDAMRGGIQIWATETAYLKDVLIVNETFGASTYGNLYRTLNAYTSSGSVAQDVANANLTQVSSTVVSQAQAIAGSDNFQTMTAYRTREAFNASGDAPVYACRAWFNVNADTNANTACTYVRTGTTVVVTQHGHGYLAGHRVYLDITSGTVVDGTYLITSVTTDTFTFTTGASGNTSGNVTNRKKLINASGNIHSIADVSVGDYRVNFLVPFQDAFYSVGGMISEIGNVRGFGFSCVYDKTIYSCKYETNNSTPTLQQYSDIGLQFFR